MGSALAEISLAHRFPGKTPLTIKVPGDSAEKGFIGSASALRFGHAGTSGMDSGVWPGFLALA